MALAAASTLAFEILLVRVFAVEQFHHFAYMAIGVAMLGFGTTGVALTLAARTARRNAPAWFLPAVFLTTVTLALAPALVTRIPVDAAQLPWELRQWVRMAAVYAVLAVPFAAGAAVVLVGIVMTPSRPGAVYGASFVGSGIGAVLALAALWLRPPAEALGIPPVVAACGGLAAALGWKRHRTLAIALLVLASTVAVRPPWRLDVAPHKALPQLSAYPGSRRVAERTSPVGWVVALDAPAFRSLPGLSLAYDGAFPRQTALLVDAALAGTAPDWDSAAQARTVLDWTPTALPYTVGSAERVLVLEAAAGTEVWAALAYGATDVTAAELNPHVPQLARRATPGRGPDDQRVRWVRGDARALAARTARLYDRVTIGLTPGSSVGAAGVRALSEDFHHTREAYERYLRLLRDEGVFAVTCWLSNPPRSSIRTILTAAAALRGVAPEHVADGLLIARSWGTATILVKPTGFAQTTVDSVRRWTTERQFDLDWVPGATAPATRFHFLDEPALFQAARAATQSPDSAQRFADQYPFDVAPVTDARPYPDHFLRASDVSVVLSQDRGDWLPFAEWGYLTLLATLCQSAVLAGALLLLPVMLRGGLLPARRGGRLIGYFTAIGLAYLTAEIAAIQQLTLLFGHPVYAVTAVLVVLLVCSGAGSVWSDGMEPRRGWAVGAVLALAFVTAAVATLPAVHWLQPSPLWWRATVAIVLGAPLAFLMGVPFPIGLRRLVGSDPAGTAWAWAANGFASVVAAPLAALISLEAGSPVAFVAAGIAYAAAAALAGRGPTPVAG
ncbi:MAG: hypothetical protein PVF27_03160 [Gemmatimonadales bacterium]